MPNFENPDAADSADMVDALAAVSGPSPSVTLSVPIPDGVVLIYPALMLIQGGAQFGPFAGTVLAGEISVSLTTVPLGLVAGDVDVQLGNLAGTDFAAVGAVIGGGSLVLGSAISAFTVALTGSLMLASGQPAAGLLLHIGASAYVQPALAGAAFAVGPQPYPPFPAPASPPAPPALLNAPPAAMVSADGMLMHRVTTNSAGVFTITLPSEAALAYSAGARTTADLDPAQGGKYAVLYAVVMPTGRTVTIPAADLPPAAADGTTDITALLNL